MYPTEREMRRTCMLHKVMQRNALQYGRWLVAWLVSRLDLTVSWLNDTTEQ